MAGSDCIFCKIASGGLPAAKVYEDDIIVAFLDIAPVTEGHTLIITKRHYSRLDQCPAGEIAVVAARIGPIAAAVTAAAGFDGYNVFCNTGRAAGQLVDHLHFHIVGRRDGDGVFSHWPAGSYDSGQMEALAGKVRQKLSGT